MTENLLGMQKKMDEDWKFIVLTLYEEAWAAMAWYHAIV